MAVLIGTTWAWREANAALGGDAKLVASAAISSPALRMPIED